MKKFKTYVVRFIILLLGLVFFFYFGLAHLLFPDNVLEFFGIPYFQPLAIVQLIGAAGIGFSVALFYVFINPGKNKGIISSLMAFCAVAAVLMSFSIIKGQLPAAEWINVVFFGTSFFAFLFSYGKI